MKIENIKDLLQQKLTAANYLITETTYQQLAEYLLLLDKWNHTYNLTSVRDVNEMVPLHILDSLSIVNYLFGERIIDVGTGAGLPGIPLAIVKPDMQFYLLDSNGKKIRFLTQVIQQLQLTNVRLIQERVENYQAERCFDIIISRAFSQIADFLAKTQHLCCQNGQFFAMKGQYPQQEVAAIPSNFQVLSSNVLTITGLNAERHLICIKKI